MRIVRPQPAHESLTHGPRPKDKQVVVGSQPVGDVVHEVNEVLEAVRLTRGLWRAASPVTHGRIVTHATSGPVMRWDIRQEPFNVRALSQQADDDGFPCVDPDEGE